MAVLTVLLFFSSLIVFVYYTYNCFINTHFRKDGMMVYDYFMKHFLKGVSNNDFNFMNYGLWDDENNTLEKANLNLCDFVYTKIKRRSSDETTDHKRGILDVGCGYGFQDIVWSKKLDDMNTKIYAIDISEKQIEYAITAQKENNISNKQLTYMVGDAMNIQDQFKCKFDTIISLESAFHYRDRPMFFKNVQSLLKDDGVFVITDIILNDNALSILSTIFMSFAIDFFNIPENNLIRLDDWKKSIRDNGLECIEIHNITEKTFDPYYRYTFHQYCKNAPLFANMCQNVFAYVQPFTYVVAVCKKKVCR